MQEAGSIRHAMKTNEALINSNQRFVPTFPSAICNICLGVRLHSLCMLQGGAEDFFFSGSFFYIPPQGPYKFSEPPKQSAEKLIPPPPPSPLPPPKKYQNKYLYNSKLYMFEISRDMFNKNIERALTVYVIPMPASLSSAN